MALTIVATAGSASANSFVTEAEQISYMATRLNASTWTTVTGATCTETEKAAMIEATRELSALRWLGYRTDDTQILSWPRQDVLNPDSPSELDLDDETIPQRVKDATAELAFQFLKAGTTDVAALDPNAHVAVKTVDVLTTEYVPVWARKTGLARYPSVLRYLRGLLAPTSGNALTVVRG